MAYINLTSADSSGFIPIIWAQEGLRVLRSNLVLAKLIARDTDFEPNPRGKALTIPYPGTFTSSLLDDSAGTNTAGVQTPSGGSSVTVTLNKLRYRDFIVTDFARTQANMELITRYVEPAVVAIAEGMEADLWTLYSSLTGGSVGTAGTNLTHATITAAMKLLNDNKAPQNDRAVVMSTKDHAALIGDSTLSNYFAFSANAGITSGKIPNLDGFDLHWAQQVPVVAGTPNATQNIAIQKNAVILATRPLEEPMDETGVKVASMTDPESGLTIRVLMQYDMNARGHRVGFDILYGYSALRPTLGVNLLS